MIEILIYPADEKFFVAISTTPFYTTHLCDLGDLE